MSASRSDKDRSPPSLVRTEPANPQPSGILTGYLSPSAGTARIAGPRHGLRSHRSGRTRGAIYLENGPLYPEMTPRELLGIPGPSSRDWPTVAWETASKRSSHSATSNPLLKKSIYKLSKGYRQRIGMAQVLLHEPDILIMDEPTSGLDPNQIRDVRELVRELGETKTILISTHILQEVKAVADQVILIHEGRIVFDGTPGRNGGWRNPRRRLLPLDCARRRPTGRSGFRSERRGARASGADAGRGGANRGRSFFPMRAVRLFPAKNRAVGVRRARPGDRPCRRGA